MAAHGTPKVFGIGLNKTGTSTLGRCFLTLGLSPKAPVDQWEARSCTRRLLYGGNYRPALEFAGRYTCFEDRPWNVWQMYRKLDEAFPGSRFVLTVRDPESWWRSVARWLSVSKPWMLDMYCRHLNVPGARAWFPGGEAVAGLRERVLGEFERYNREVMDHFSGRAELLVIDFEKGEGWDVLCPFLDRPVPSVPVPHENRQYYDRRDRIGLGHEIVNVAMMLLGKRLGDRRRPKS